MTSQEEGAAVIDAALSELVGVLHDRLLRLEPYRAQLQMQAREAEGRPLDANAAEQLASHLALELGAQPDYRVLTLLRQAQAELRPPPDAPTAEPVAAAPPAPLTVAVAEVAAANRLANRLESDDPHTLARAAVAEVFGTFPRVLEAVGEAPAATETAPLQAPVPLAQPAPQEPSPASAPIAITGAAFDGVDAAGAGVLASLAKLRAPPAAEAAAMPPSPEPSPAAVTITPVVLLTAPVETPPAHAGPKSPPVSMEGTLANVAKAVAATVAAAERLSEPPAERNGPAFAPAPPVAPLPPPAAAAASRIFARSADRFAASPSPPRDLAAGEATEIRFVARPANPLLDALPRSLQMPRTQTPAAAVLDRQPEAAADIASPSGWEEASVEIRRSPGKRPPPAGLDLQEGPGNRASSVLNRFVKALRGAKE